MIRGRNLLKFSTIFVMALLWFALINIPRTQAGINPQINFQGKLTNTDGTNVINGTYSIVFSIYTVSSGGANVWTETQGAVTLTDGIFNVALGSVTTLPGSVDFNTSSLFLGIKVGTDAEMTPRVQFTSSPYSFNSSKLNGLDSTGYVQLAQSLQTDSSTNSSINITKSGASGNLLTLTKSAGGSFNIVNSGAVDLKVDATAALSIRNSAGTTTYFNVDTTGNIVQIGSATPDSTGVVLVFDSLNTVADPTGGAAVNGSEYYNSALQQYRCRRDGAWEACGTNSIDRGWELDDEFLTGYTGGACTTTTAIVGNQNWACYASGAATTGYNIGTILPTADHPGIIRLTTAAALGNGFTMALTGNNSGSVIVSPRNRVQSSAGLGSTITNNILRIGLHSETTTNVRPLSGVWWEADPTTNANWQYCYGTGAVATCAATAVAIAANTLYSLDIQVTATGAATSAATFVVNGTPFSVSAVTIDSTNRVNPAIACYNSVAAARECFVDYYKYSGVATTRR